MCHASHKLMGCFGIIICGMSRGSKLKIHVSVAFPRGRSFSKAHDIHSDRGRSSTEHKGLVRGQYRASRSTLLILLEQYELEACERDDSRVENLYSTHDVSRDSRLICNRKR